MKTVNGMTVSPAGEAVAVRLQSLKDMQAAVGGYIEPITPLFSAVQVYVNEEANLFPDQHPPNTWATMLCGRPIRGQVLIVGLAQRGDDTSLADDHADMLIASVADWYHNGNAG